jgi:hypothetical protein
MPCAERTAAPVKYTGPPLNRTHPGPVSADPAWAWRLVIFRCREYGAVRISALREVEQLADLDLRLDLGLAGFLEPDLAAGQRVLPGVHPGTDPLGSCSM